MVVFFFLRGGVVCFIIDVISLMLSSESHFEKPSWTLPEAPASELQVVPSPAALLSELLLVPCAFMTISYDNCAKRWIKHRT